MEASAVNIGINVIAVLVMLIMFFWKKSDRHSDLQQQLVKEDIKEIKKDLHDTRGRLAKIELIHGWSQDEIKKIHDSIKDIKKANDDNARNIQETKNLIENFKDFITDFIKK